MACYQKICCPYCKQDDVIRHSKSAKGAQRFLCKNDKCETKTFMLDYCYKACKPGIREQVVEMAINGAGVRDTARVLGIDKNTVMSTLKKIRQNSSGQS